MRDKFDNSDTKFTAFIKSVLHQKFDKKMEIARYEFLEEIFPDKKAIKQLGNLISFNCDVSIGGLFTSIFAINSDIMSSRQRTQNCSNCGYKDTTESPFVNHTAKIDFKNIQQSIEVERTRVCETCSQKTMIIEDQFHEVVVIDCESLDGEDELTSINDIQQQVKLNEDEYELFATIEYDPRIKHFIPHIKRITHRWETYDDLNSVKTDTDIYEEMYIFMLFYKKKISGMYLVACICNACIVCLNITHFYFITLQNRIWYEVKCLPLQANHLKRGKNLRRRNSRRKKNDHRGNTSKKGTAKPKISEKVKLNPKKKTLKKHLNEKIVQQIRNPFWNQLKEN